MKHTIKHPDGSTYDLTLEEIKSPLLIKQLKIDASWSIKQNNKWISLNAFLWEQNQKLAQEPPEKKVEKISEYTPSKIDKMLQGDASWSPISIFGLVIRFVGLFLVAKSLMGITSITLALIGYSKIRTPGGQLIETSSISPPHIINLLAAIAMTILGCYLMRRPHKLVSLAFSEDE